MLSRMDCKSEAYNFAHRGFENDNKSIFCLIILVLVCQSDFDYKKAIELLENALKIGPVNIQLLRYLSLLQAQTWNLPAFVECRRQILTLEPDVCFHYIAHAVSHHLNGNCLEAIKILEGYEKSLGHGSSSEHKGMLLYKISLLEESGNLRKALKVLLDEKLFIDDDVAFNEQHASLLVKLDALNDAKGIYTELLFQKPENYSYHAGLRKCVVSSDNGQCSANEIQELYDSYKSLREHHSSSSVVKRIPLDFLQGEEFRKALEIYIRPLLNERAHSLFSDLLSLYEHPDKVGIIDQVILELERSIRENKEPSQSLMWTLCFSAQHYDRCGQYEIALAKVDEAIKQNQAVAELYVVKGRILKHAGDLETAASIAEKAKDMDPRNCFTKKYVKRMLQVDRDVVYKKDGKDQENSLHGMECMWYELASGDCYFRRGDLGRSLKNYLAVMKCYTELFEYHFDFRSYHSGKMTLLESVEMLRYKERWDPGSYFHKAAAGVIRGYIELYDSSTKSDDETPKDQSHKMISDKKMQETTASRVSNSMKLRDTSSRRKGKAHAKEMGDKNKEETSSASKCSDPIGAKLLQVENPLLEATKYLKLLRKSFPDSFETYFLLFELHMRNEDMLEAYRVKFHGRLDNMVLEESVRTALKDPLSTLQKKSLIRSVMDFYQRHGGSLIHTVAAAEMLFFLQPCKKFAIIKLIEVTMNSAEDIKKLWRLNDCIAVHTLLRSVFGDAKTASRWNEQCKLLFPLASYFSAMTNKDAFLNAHECESWCLDSGSSRHCTNNDSLIFFEAKNSGASRTSSGGLVSHSVVGSSVIHFEGSDREYCLDGVVLLPTGVINIVSVQKFILEYSYLIQFFHDDFLLRDKRYTSMVFSEFVLAKGPVFNHLYFFMSKLPGQKEENSGWILDSCAGRHSTSDESLLLTGTIRDCEPMIATDVDGILKSSSKKGVCELTYSFGDGVTTKFVLNDVYIFPQGPTLLSLSAFTKDNKCSVLFTPDEYYILDAKDNMLLKPELTRGYGLVKNCLYYLR